MMSADGAGRFPTTRWTLITRLKSPDASTSRRALEELCSQYHYPFYCYIRRRGFDHHDAQDALHDFLVKLLRLGAFADADAEQGRLRAFLCTALQRFLINWRRDQTHRAREVSLDFVLPGDDPEERYRREPVCQSESAERLFDRKWGHELLQRVLCRLSESYAARDRTPLFETLRPVLLAGGSLRGGDTASLAASLAVSEGTLRVALSRLLSDYRGILEDEVLQTVESSAEVDGEIAHLLGVFHTG